MKRNNYQLWRACCLVFILIVLEDLYHSRLFCLSSGEFLWLLWHPGPQLLAPASARPPPLRRPNMVSEDNCSGCRPSRCQYHNRANDRKGRKPSLRASNLQSFMIRDSSSQKWRQVVVPQCRLSNSITLMPRPFRRSVFMVALLISTGSPVEQEKASSETMRHIVNKPVAWLSNFSKPGNGCVNWVGLGISLGSWFG